MASSGPVLIIPGLLNELAMEVVLRLPPDFDTTGMKVNGVWQIILSSYRFYCHRRLRFPYPSLVLLLHGLNKRPLRRPPSASNQDYEFFDFNFTDLASPPRLLSSSDSWHLSRYAAHDLLSDCFASLGNHSFLVLDPDAHDGWMQFNAVSRKWTRFGTPGHWPFPFEVQRIYLLGSLGNRVFLLASTTETASRKVALSYDHSKHVWETHMGLPQSFSLDRNRLTLQGRIFVRNSATRQRTVYTFDVGGNRWQEDTLMTERLSKVPAWGRVIATPDGALIAALQGKNGRLLVKYQEAGTLTWCSPLEIETGSRYRVEFHLFIREEHVVLVIESSKANVQMGITAVEEHCVGHHRITCLFVPYYVLMGAVFIHG